jgi:hypothetical protein
MRRRKRLKGVIQNAETDSLSFLHIDLLDRMRVVPEV